MGHSRVLGLSGGFVLLVAVCMVQCEELSSHADLGGLAKVPRGEKLGEVATVGDSGATGMSQNSGTLIADRTAHGLLTKEKGVMDMTLGSIDMDSRRHDDRHDDIARYGAGEDTTDLVWDFLEVDEDPTQQPPPPPPPAPPPPSPTPSPTKGQDDSVDDEDVNVDKIVAAGANATEIGPPNPGKFNLSDVHAAHHQALQDLSKANQMLEKATAERDALYNQTNPIIGEADVSRFAGESTDRTQVVSLDDAQPFDDTSLGESGPTVPGPAAPLTFARIQQLHIGSLMKVNDAAKLNIAAGKMQGWGAKKELEEKVKAKKEEEKEKEEKKDKKKKENPLAVEAGAAEAEIHKFIEDGEAANLRYAKAQNLIKAKEVVDTAVVKEQHQKKLQKHQEDSIEQDSAVPVDSHPSKKLSRAERRRQNADHVEYLTMQLQALSKVAARRPGKARDESAINALKNRIKKELDGLKTGHELKRKRKLRRLEQQRRKREREAVARKTARQIKRARAKSESSLAKLQSSAEKVRQSMGKVKMPEAVAVAKSMQEMAKGGVERAAGRIRAEADERVLQITAKKALDEKISKLKQEALFPPRELVKAVQDLQRKSKEASWSKEKRAAEKKHAEALAHVQKHEEEHEQADRSAAEKRDDLVKKHDAVVNGLDNPGRGESAAAYMARMAREKAKEEQASKEHAELVRDKAEETMRSVSLEDTKAKIEAYDDDCTNSKEELASMQKEVYSNDCLNGGESEICEDLQDKLSEMHKHIAEIGGC